MAKEDYKRPNHNDFRFTSELMKTNFTGVRNNSLLDMQELWINGEIVLAMRVEDIVRDPSAWDKAYSQFFAMDDLIVTEENKAKSNLILPPNLNN